MDFCHIPVYSELTYNWPDFGKASGVKWIAVIISLPLGWGHVAALHNSMSEGEPVQ